MSERLTQLKKWLHEQTGQECELAPASSDASFRRYFRIGLEQGSRIVMDAPPEQEDCRPFIHVAALLQGAGLNAPEIIAADLDEGFLLLGDLGNTTYLEVLNTETVDGLYGDALGALIGIQTCVDTASAELPAYDEAMLQTELDLFKDWYLEKHSGVSLNAEQQAVWQQTCQILISSALEQPTVCVHRDYHSRNLMQVEAGRNPGILDFQDAVIGPVTYDLVSLLRDCYISWPCQQVEEWVDGFYEQAVHSGIVNADRISEKQFLKWFDLMGVQRHLKAIGIFARLLHRDNKEGYIQDIPRTLSYVMDVCQRSPELQDFYQLLLSLTLPDHVS